MFRRQIELKATRNNCRLVKSNNEKAKIVNIVEIIHIYINKIIIYANSNDVIRNVFFIK